MPLTTNLGATLKKHVLKAIIYCTVLLCSVQVDAKKLQVTMADVGPRPTNALEGIKAFAQTHIKDPDSAKYEIAAMSPGYCRSTPFPEQRSFWLGWAVNVLINAKNSYGGYGGFQEFTVLFVGDRATDMLEGFNFGNLGPAKGLRALDAGTNTCQFVNE